MKIKALTLAGHFLMMMMCDSVSAEVRLPIYAFGVQNSTIIIDAEAGTLVPSLADVPLSEEILSEIVPYKGAEQNILLIKTLLAQKDIKLGSASLYFYLGVNHALDRIFRNRMLGLGYENDSAGPEVKNDDRFSNLRQFAKIRPLSQKELRLRVFFSKDKFNKASKILGLHSASAYWDPKNETIGIFFDARIFRWYRDRSGRQEQQVVTSAVQVRDYVTRQTMELVAHELVHFLQHNDGFLEQRPFLAEAAALIVQSNISMREDISRISKEHTMRGLPLIPQDQRCRALLWASPPMFGASLARYQRGVKAARRSALLPRLLLADARAFYSQGPHDLADAYDIALAFSMFAAAMPRPEFMEKVAPLLTSYAPLKSSALQQVAQAFKIWAEDTMAPWTSANLEDEYEATMQLTSACMKNRDYIAALAGAWRMKWLKPDSTMGLVYAGDVYFRVNVPFFAFDHYALANQSLRNAPDASQSGTLIETRLADAFELVGDIEEAQNRFDKVGQLKLYQNSDFVIPILRSRLKANFYRLALSAGYARNLRALYVLNSFVDEMQSGCTAESKEQFETSIEDAFDTGTHVQVIERRFEQTLQKMVAEMEAANIELLWKRRSAACQNMGERPQ